MWMRGFDRFYKGMDTEDPANVLMKNLETYYWGMEPGTEGYKNSIDYVHSPNNPDSYYNYYPNQVMGPQTYYEGMLPNFNEAQESKFQKLINSIRMGQFGGKWDGTLPYSNAPQESNFDEIANSVRRAQFSVR